jgi:hypothetical protein
MSTISNIISHGVTFDNAAYPSPLTITTAGYVNAGTNGAHNAAVYAEAAASLYLLNEGRIRAAGTVIGVLEGATNGFSLNNTGTITAANGYGVAMAHPGPLTNSGTISSSGNMAMHASGSLQVTNSVTGLISGSVGGVIGDRGTVVNDGTIRGTAAGGFGIQFLDNGGTINNNGLVTAGAYGLVLDGTGSVTNSGTVTAGRWALQTRGAVSVSNTGTLYGGSQGVILFSQGGPSTVTNSGEIIGAVGRGVGYSAGFITNNATIYGTYQVGVILSAGGAVTNVGGLIKSNLTYTAVLLYGGTAANVTNYGTIIGYTGLQFFSGGTYSVPATVTNTGTILGRRHRHRVWHRERQAHPRGHGAEDPGHGRWRRRHQHARVHVGGEQKHADRGRRGFCQFGRGRFPARVVGRSLASAHRSGG